MSNYKYFDALADETSGIVGAHLKCTKGEWTLDGEPIQDDFRVAVIIDTAEVGEVRWEGGRIVERRVGLLKQGAMPPTEKCEEGWCPYTSILCVDEGRGYCTFTSSSWGGLKALKALLKPFQLAGHARFPICALGKKERHNDKNGNVDPTFRITGWTARENFRDLLPDEPPALSFVEPLGDDQVQSKELISDEIPF